MVWVSVVTILSWVTSKMGFCQSTCNVEYDWENWSGCCLGCSGQKNIIIQMFLGRAMWDICWGGHWLGSAHKVAQNAFTRFLSNPSGKHMISMAAAFCIIFVWVLLVACRKAEQGVSARSDQVDQPKTHLNGSGCVYIAAQQRWLFQIPRWFGQGFGWLWSGVHHAEQHMKFP